jgi:hypothetical protein
MQFRNLVIAPSHVFGFFALPGVRNRSMWGPRLGIHLLQPQPLASKRRRHLQIPGSTAEKACRRFLLETVEPDNVAFLLIKGRVSYGYNLVISPHECIPR